MISFSAPASIAATSISSAHSCWCQREESKVAKVVEAKIVIPLKGGGIGEVSNIDKVLLEIEDVLVERLGVVLDVTGELTRKLPPRKEAHRLKALSVSSIIPSSAKPHSD